MTSLSGQIDVRVKNPSPIADLSTSSAASRRGSLSAQQSQWEKNFRQNVCEITFQMLDKVDRTVKQVILTTVLERHERENEAENGDLHRGTKISEFSFPEPKTVGPLFLSKAIDKEMESLIPFMQFDRSICQGRFSVTLVSPKEPISREWLLAGSCAIHHREDSSVDLKGPEPRSYALEGNLSPNSSLNSLISDVQQSHENVVATRDALRRYSGASEDEMAASHASSLDSSPQMASSPASVETIPEAHDDYETH